MAELIEKLGIDWRLLIANAGTFLILLWILRKFAYGPILNVLDQRQQKISDSLTAAERAEAHAKQAETERQAAMKAARQEADAIMAATEKQAAEVRSAALAKAEAEAEALVTKTRQQLSQERQKMMDEAKAELAEVVVLATQRVVGEQLDDKLQTKLAEQALSAVEKTRA